MGFVLAHRLLTIPCRVAARLRRNLFDPQELNHKHLGELCLRNNTLRAFYDNAAAPSGAASHGDAVAGHVRAREAHAPGGNKLLQQRAHLANHEWIAV